MYILHVCYLQQCSLVKVFHSCSYFVWIFDGMILTLIRFGACGCNPLEFNKYDNYISGCVLDCITVKEEDIFSWCIGLFVTSLQCCLIPLLLHSVIKFSTSKESAFFSGGGVTGRCC